MSLWYECGNGLVEMPKSYARCDLNTDAYLCCPGPSLKNVKDSDLHIPGAMVFGLNTSYPHIRPDIWIGMDGAECYDRNLWWEPFMKICRGGYPNIRIGNRYVRHCPNVYFADVEKGGVADIFNRRQHGAKFIWENNSFAVALHIMVWMGAKQINLLGCDFGGTSDYYDDRKLSDVNKKRNKKLYKQQVKFMKAFVSHAKNYGVNVNSCTPDSPINKFIDYIDVKEALNRSKSKIPKITNDILYATDAEHCRWHNNVKHDKGVMVGCAKIHQDMIPWWIHNYKKHNDYPIAFADFGITEPYKKICRQHGELIDATNFPVEGWFRKPFAILKAPFKKIIWCDTDIEIRRNMEELFTYSDDGKIGVGWDSFNPDSFRANVPKKAKLWDSGLISVQHGNTIVNYWTEKIMAAPKDKFHGDHEALSITLWEHDMPIKEIPKTMHRMRIDPEADKVDNSKLMSMHWTGPTGKRHIRTQLSKGIKGGSYDM